MMQIPIKLVAMELPQLAKQCMLRLLFRQDVEDHRVSKPTPKELKALVSKESELTRDIFALLLKHGANPKIKDKYGKDAFDYSYYEENKDILIELSKQVEQPSLSC